MKYYYLATYHCYLRLYNGHIPSNISYYVSITYRRVWIPSNTQKYVTLSALNFRFWGFTYPWKFSADRWFANHRMLWTSAPYRKPILVTEIITNPI